MPAMTQPPTQPEQPPYAQAGPVSPAGPYPPQQYAPISPMPQQVIVVAQSKPTSAWAVVGLIFGILGLLSGWCTFAIPAAVAVVCGHAAWPETKQGSTHSGHGMTIASLVMGYLVVAPMGLFFLFGIIGALTSR